MVAEAAAAVAELMMSGEPKSNRAVGVGGDELDPTILPPGTRLGEYVVEARLGHGGMGTVYRVSRGEDQFALKINSHRPQDLPEEQRKDLDARMKREVGTLATLCHPNILEIRSFDRWPKANSGYLYMVTDLIVGDRLYVWQEKTTPSLRKLVTAFARIADGLQEMHRHAIFHRDLKQENVLVRENGEPVIIDFGIARLSNAYTLTSLGAILGTSKYFSPQYCRFLLAGKSAEGAKYQFSPYDDLHAVGFMLYEMLTGKAPFQGSDGDELTLLYAIADQVPKPPVEVNPAVPESLSVIAMRLLEKEPKDAFPSGAALVEALAEAANGADESWDTPFVPPGRRRSFTVPTVDDRGGGEEAREGIEANAKAKGNGVDDLLMHEDTLPSPPKAPTGGAEGPRDETQAPGKAFNPPSSIKQSFAPPEPGTAPAQQEGPKGSATPVRFQQVQEELSRNSASDWRKSLRWLLVGAGVAGGLALVAWPRQARELAGPPVPLLATPEGPSAAAVERSERASSSNPPGAAEVRPSTAEAAPAGLNGPEVSDASALKALGENRPTAKHKPNTTAKNSSGLVTATRLGKDEWPSFLVRPQSLNKPKAANAEPKKLGVPFGAHIPAVLKSNLDSRTIGSGLVEAALKKAFFHRGEIRLPTGTMLYGKATTNGDRFNIEFTKARLPDETEIAITAYALDPADGKPGLQASRRITGEDPSREGVGETIAKSTARSLLGKGGGDTAGELAASAGNATLNQPSERAQPSNVEVILAEHGSPIELFVRETF